MSWEVGRLFSLIFLYWRVFPIPIRLAQRPETWLKTWLEGLGLLRSN